MIQNHSQYKQMMQSRLDLKTCETMLSNIINLGTSCSLFESEVIVQKAKEVFCIGEYTEKMILQPGQMVINAIKLSEPAGKPIKECQMKRIIVSYIHETDNEVYDKHGLSAKRQAQILRMTNEAVDQKACLTQEDLSRILNCNVRTIRRDINKIKKSGIIVPTRGQQKDIGPGITHREKAVQLFLEGKEPLEIANEIKHSLRSVERYVDTFCRVVFCQNKLGNTLQTALVIGCSVTLVNTYLKVKSEYELKPEYTNRIEEIGKRGKAYWDNIDFKKNVSHSERRLR
jgi:DNA-binding CsgD family transcriptional regulator